MITDLTQLALARSLDASAMRHKAIANNIANVETPGYRRREVDFEADLRAALDAPSAGAAREREVASVQPVLREDSASPEQLEGSEGNNVDPEQEMTDLAENTIQYQAVLHSMSIRSGMVRTAIFEGRR